MNEFSLHIIDKVLTGSASAEEEQMMEAWFQSMQENPGLLEQMSEPEAVELKDSMLISIHQQLGTEPEFSQTQAVDLSFRS